MSEAKWFGRRSVGTLAQMQNSGDGVTPAVRTMIGAYTQYDDIGALLKLLVLTPENEGALAPVIARHEKYKVWVERETT